VIGQERAQRVLAGVVANPQYMTSGFIFSGPEGVGKTTTAYLFAKAIMCQSTDPFDCNSCPSCLLFTAEDIEGRRHPDFEEVDAAGECGGVDAARALVTLSNSPAQCAKRRAILIDEAHRLSREAWDVYLKPLEKRSTDAIFIFSTTERVSDPKTVIPRTIVSRSTILEFSRVIRDSILGLLMSRADSHKIPYTLDGLRRIADLAAGRPRDALKMLQTVAVVGKVSPENCAAVLAPDLNETALSILSKLVQSSRTTDMAERLVSEAMGLADNAAQISSAAALIDALFRVYAQKFFENSEIARAFANYRAVTAVLLKWSQPQQVPIDALPILLMELGEFLPGKTPVFATPETRQMLRRPIRETSELLVDNNPRPSNAPVSASDLSRLLGV
jgi:DNA polymerase III subunit gamma/tau